VVLPVTDLRLLQHYVDLWRLEPDGIPFDTAHSWLLAVRQGGVPAILKLRKTTSDEHLTAALLAYYDGRGAVRLLQAHERAVLMERACGVRSLWAMATSGEDDAAAEILADMIAELHAPRTQPRPAGLMPLAEWFASLFHQRARSPLFAAAADVAKTLLAHPHDETVLHGDLHHSNVVLDVRRGWLAIDPKGLWGERAYDVANLLRNPQHHPGVVHDTARMHRHAHLYAARLHLDVGRILRFAFAHAALSAAWSIEDGDDPTFSLKTAEVAQTCLGAT
jgi:streptomycin 6-kinase